MNEKKKIIVYKNTDLPGLTFENGKNMKQNRTNGARPFSR